MHYATGLAPGYVVVCGFTSGYQESLVDLPLRLEADMLWVSLSAMRLRRETWDMGRS